MLTTAAGVKDLAMFDHHGEEKKNTRQKQASNVEAAAMKHSCAFHVSTWERVIPKPAYKCNKHNVWDVKVPMTPIKRKEGPGTPKMRRSHFFCCSFLRFTAPWAPKKKKMCQMHRTEIGGHKCGPLHFFKIVNTPHRLL